MMMMGDRKKAVAAILGPVEGKKPEEPGKDALHAIAEELIECIHAKDAAGAAAALKAAFSECDSEPHVEGAHIEED